MPGRSDGTNIGAIAISLKPLKRIQLLLSAYANQNAKITVMIVLITEINIEFWIDLNKAGVEK